MQYVAFGFIGEKKLWQSCRRMKTSAEWSLHCAICQHNFISKHLLGQHPRGWNTKWFCHKQLYDSFLLVTEIFGILREAYVFRDIEKSQPSRNAVLLTKEQHINRSLLKCYFHDITTETRLYSFYLPLIPLFTVCREIIEVLHSFENGDTKNISSFWIML